MHVNDGRSPNWARMRPAREMSRSSTSTPACPAPASAANSRSMASTAAPMAPARVMKKSFTAWEKALGAVDIDDRKLEWAKKFGATLG